MQSFTFHFMTYILSPLLHPMDNSFFFFGPHKFVDFGVVPKSIPSSFSFLGILISLAPIPNLTPFLKKERSLIRKKRVWFMLWISNIMVNYIWYSTRELCEMLYFNFIWWVSGLFMLCWSWGILLYRSTRTPTHSMVVSKPLISNTTQLLSELAWCNHHNLLKWTWSFQVDCR